MMARIVASVAIAILAISTPSNASLPCSSNDNCAVGSTCEGGRCSNPFEKGCLRTMAERKKGEHHNNHNQYTFKKRVCNSDDEATGGDTATCIKPEFPYKEVRIATADHDGSIIMGWFYQIFLSEVFGVPVTFETGSFDESQDDISKRQHGSFYDTESRFDYPDQNYPVGHLVEADRVGGDCSLTNKQCAHILPDVWGGASNREVALAQEEGSVVRNLEPNGIVGAPGYFIPAYTAKQHLSFTSFYGIRGEEHRAELADIFKEPTTWAEYCELVDPTNCTVTESGGTISKRFPTTDKERDSYFVPDFYIGHFRVTDSTNCTKNPDTCKGNLVGPPCSWTTYAENQMYWNEIGLTLNGPELPNNGYSASHMKQIWRAANATKSHVFFYWFAPTFLIDAEFGDSEDYTFQRVSLPVTTEECVNYRERKLNDMKCSNNTEVRRGAAIGSCDNGAITPHKIISRGLETSSLAGGVEGMQSPAYTFLMQVSLPPYAIPRIYRQWSRLTAKNGTRYDDGYAARESLCGWVYENHEQLTQRFWLESFPRKMKLESYPALTYTGYMLGSIALVLTVVAATCIYVWRNHTVIKSAQLNVLTAMIVGYILAGISAILHAVTATSDVICTLQQWTLRLSYCLEVVPILIKMSLINNLGRQARVLNKIQIDPNSFKKHLVMVIAMLLLYLTIWTSIDMPKRTDDFEIFDMEGEVTIVALYAGCASSRAVWGSVSLGVESFVLLSATILAYQSREMIGKLSESHWLAFLVYFHSLFLLIRIVIQVLLVSDMMKSAMSTKMMAIVVALETIAAMLVYFLPKFVTIKSKKAVKEIPVRILSRSGRSRYISGITIPDGGIPNLIKKKPEECNRRSITSGTSLSRLKTNIDSSRTCYSTLSSRTSIFTSNNPTSTKGLVTAGPTSSDGLSKRAVLFGENVSTRTATGTDQTELLISQSPVTTAHRSLPNERLKDELRESMANNDLLMREICELKKCAEIVAHKERKSLETVVSILSTSSDNPSQNMDSSVYSATQIQKLRKKREKD